MGLFDGKSYSTSDANGFLNIGGGSQHRSSSRNRGASPARSAHTTGGGTGYYVRHNSSSSRPGYARSASGSFFGGGGSSRGIFSGGGSSSYYKRRPRDGYISYLIHKLQRMFKELWYYARRHPVKAFFAVVVPLLSAGGAIHGLMRQVGIRMPFGLDGAARRYTGSGGYYGSRGYEGSGGGWMENAGGLMQMAKLFM